VRLQATATLKAAQEAEDSPEARATLPRLSLSDLDKEEREIPIAVSTERGRSLCK
jgi:presequence protease